jgi:hypothetical protein
MSVITQTNSVFHYDTSFGLLCLTTRIWHLWNFRRWQWNMYLNVSHLYTLYKQCSYRFPFPNYLPSELQTSSIILRVLVLFLDINSQCLPIVNRWLLSSVSANRPLQILSKRTCSILLGKIAVNVIFKKSLSSSRNIGSERWNFSNVWYHGNEYHWRIKVNVSDLRVLYSISHNIWTHFGVITLSVLSSKFFKNIFNSSSGIPPG